jgi:hypothetical protein
MIGASLMLLYELYKIVVREIEEDSGIKSIPNKLHGFTTEWSADYISLALSTVALLYSEETLNLGACGTHILEHYFEAIRRHSGGDNTHDRFMKSMKKVFLEQHLLLQLNIPREHLQRRSDSGYIVRGDKSTEKNKLMYYLQIARGLMQTFMNVPEAHPIYSFALPEEPITIKSFTERYLEIEEKNSKFISTKTTGKTATGGLRNYRIWGAKKQMEDSGKV